MYHAGFKFDVLDEGFVSVVDYMGNDKAIAEAAWVSTKKNSEDVKDIERIINYMMRNGHTSPFEMCEIKLHVKLPIFVARQWIRHRTANVNEYSGRYSKMPNEFYCPENWHTQSKTNNQGSNKEDVVILEKHLGSKTVTVPEDCFNLYEELLEAGVSKEEARIHLPLSTYTEWFWKIDLHNLFHFLQLRNDPHAQKEIREYAYAIEQIVGAWVPIAYNAYVKKVNRDNFAKKFLWEKGDFYDISDLIKIAIDHLKEEDEYLKPLAEKIINEIDNT